MTRKLPWKDGLAARGVRVKEPSKATNTKPTPSEDEDLTDKADANARDVDHSDDDNYRMTESEFMDTARYFTKELHQQAYDRLLQEQEKEADTANTLTDLLGQPALQAGFTSSTLNQTILESKVKQVIVPKPIKSEVGVKASLLSGPSNVTVSTSLEKGKLVVPLPKTTVGNSASRSVETPLESKPMTATKLSDAAIARRQKRQQAQKLDAAAVPSFR